MIVLGFLIGLAAVATAFAAGYYTGRRDTDAENERLRTHIDKGGLPALERFERALAVLRSGRRNRQPSYRRRLP